MTDEVTDGTPEATTVETEGSTGGLTGEQLARLRETLIAAHADAVPELIAGSDFDALLASVEPARAAYRRVREEAAREATGEVSRGGGVREPDVRLYADLAPEAKIAAALTARRA